MINLQTLLQNRILLPQLLSLALLSLVLIALPAAPAMAQAPWTTADGSGNINNTNSKNVGIGTSTPATELAINKGQNAGTTLSIDNSYTTSGNAAFSGFWFRQGGANRFYFGANNDGNTTQNGGPGAVMFWNFINAPMLFSTNNTERMRIDASGSVGIGTSAPSTKLHVVGDVNVTGSGSITAAGTITGGTINAKYQDVAEWVPASEQIPVGTVVVLDATKSNHVTASTKGYDRRVAGVISEQPGITLGESGDNKVLVATTGRVRIKVDATRGPIQIGDLGTSDVPGLAMKSEPVNIGAVQLHRPGTLIGKALEPLAKGTGEILVLLSLQ